MKKRLLPMILAVTVLLTCLSSGVADTESISIVFTFDKASYEIGTPVTVAYAITGGSGSYISITYSCFA